MTWNSDVGEEESSLSSIKYFQTAGSFVAKVQSCSDEISMSELAQAKSLIEPIPPVLRLN